MLNDQNRKPFWDVSDEILTYLQDMVKRIHIYSPLMNVHNIPSGYGQHGQKNGYVFTINENSKIRFGIL